MASSISSNERVFITNAMARDNLRLDGRSCTDMRQIKFTFFRSQARAQCEVQLGKTRVLSVVSATVTEPFIDRPNEGQLQFNVELSPMASKSFVVGRPGEGAAEITRIIEKEIVQSKAIDREALCIITGKKVWSIRCDMHVLDHGGNIIDAVALATMAALSHFRLPEVGKINEEDIVVYSYEDREPSSLSIHHSPLCVTFGFIDDGNLFFVDPTDREEQVMEGRLTFVFNTHGEICGVHKISGPAVDLSLIMLSSKHAAAKVAAISSVMKDALSKANADAVKDVMMRARRLTGEWRGVEIDTAAATTNAALKPVPAVPVVSSRVAVPSLPGHEAVKTTEKSAGNANTSLASMFNPTSKIESWSDDVEMKETQGTKDSASTAKKGKKKAQKGEDDDEEEEGVVVMEGTY